MKLNIYKCAYLIKHFGLSLFIINIIIKLLNILELYKVAITLYAIKMRLMKICIIAKCNNTMNIYSLKKFDVDTTASNEAYSIWFQGYENAPEIVKKCLSVKRINGFSHTILDEKQIEQLDIDNTIKIKRREGKISYAMYSDIVRAYLLSKRGGLWCDATLLVLSVDENFFKKPFTTVHHTIFQNQRHLLCNPSIFKTDKCEYESKWTGFFMYSRKNGATVSFLYDMLCEYWQKNDYQMDYFLIDAIIRIGYENIPAIKNEIDNVEINNNGNLHCLQQLISQQYDETTWNKLSDQKCNVFKLSYKDLPEKRTEPSFYTKCINNQ